MYNIEYTLAQVPLQSVGGLHINYIMSFVAKQTASIYIVEYAYAI